METIDLLGTVLAALRAENIEVDLDRLIYSHNSTAFFLDPRLSLLFEALYRRAFLIRKREFEILQTNHIADQRMFIIIIQEKNYRHFFRPVSFKPVVFVVHYDQNNQVTRLENHFDLIMWLFKHLGIYSQYSQLNMSLINIFKRLSVPYGKALKAACQNGSLQETH